MDNNSEVTASIFALKYQDTVVTEGILEQRDICREWFFTVMNVFPSTFPRLLEKSEWKIPVVKVCDACTYKMY